MTDLESAWERRDVPEERATYVDALGHERTEELLDMPPPRLHADWDARDGAHNARKLDGGITWARKRDDAPAPDPFDDDAVRAPLNAAVAPRLQRVVARNRDGAQEPAARVCSR